MADNGSRSFRRAAPTRDADPAPSGGLADPLAELARLIGQSDRHGDPHGDRHGGEVRDRGYAPEALDGAAPASDFDWAADEDYAKPSHEAADDYASPGPAQSYYPHPSDAGAWPRERSHEDDAPAAPRQYFAPSGPAAAPAPAPAAPFDDRREDHSGHAGQWHDAREHQEPLPAAARAQAMPFTPPAPPAPPARDAYLADNRARYGAPTPPHAEDSADEEYDEESQPRRRGTVVIIALLGLAVLGTAGALGYRAMFGGSVIPTLPPIIKPSGTPVKIVPSHESQAGTPGQADTANTGSAERLVNHEEQPVDIQSQSANPVPRVVATIPVISNTADGEMASAQPAATAVPAAPAPPPSPNVLGEQNIPSQIGGPAVTAPAPPPPGTREIHTVTIRPDQPDGVQMAPAAPAVAAPIPVARPTRVSRPRRAYEPETASAGPLSIVPMQERRALPPPPPRAYRARTSETGTRETGPLSLTSRPAEAVPVAGGGFAVQLSSRRSEAEARAAFRSLQTRFPRQLGGRRPMIRRTNLGAKGIYYRVLVGPFAGEQAVSLCSSLKAAGGSCIIQKI